MYRTMTIGDVLRATRHCDAEHLVFFDFCGACPVDVGSSRGSYDEPSLIPEKAHGAKCTVEDLRKMLERLLDEEFEGYKGGNYRYERSSPLWVDEYGEWTSTGIIGVVEEHPWYENSVVLITGPAGTVGANWKCPRMKGALADD